MRNFWCGLSLLTVAFSLIGCASTREPHVVIAPTFSYVQYDLAHGVDAIESADTPATASARPAVAKLPPTPAAPGFTTLVFVDSDEPDTR